MSITNALLAYMHDIDESDVSRAMLRHPGPYRAISAYKGDEERGERDFPWIVVGTAGINCFGRLWTKDLAIEVANVMNARPAPPR